MCTTVWVIKVLFCTNYFSISTIFASFPIIELELECNRGDEVINLSYEPFTYDDESIWTATLKMHNTMLLQPHKWKRKKEINDTAFDMFRLGHE